MYYIWFTFRVNVGKYMVNYTMQLHLMGKHTYRIDGYYEGALAGTYHSKLDAMSHPTILNSSNNYKKIYHEYQIYQIHIFDAMIPMLFPVLLPFFPMVLPTFRLRHCNTATSIMR